MKKNDLLDRVERLEIAAEPTDVLAWYSKDGPAFPIETPWDKPARLFAYSELKSLWYERQAVEAEKSYDRELYRGIICVTITYPGMYTTEAARIAAFREALDAGKFTPGEYLAELFEAAAWSERNDFPKPSNLLKHAHKEGKA